MAHRFMRAAQRDGSWAAGEHVGEVQTAADARRLGVFERALDRHLPRAARREGEAEGTQGCYTVRVLHAAGENLAEYYDGAARKCGQAVTYELGAEEDRVHLWHASSWRTVLKQAGDRRPGLLSGLFFLGCFLVCAACLVSYEWLCLSDGSGGGGGGNEHHAPTPGLLPYASRAWRSFKVQK